MSKSSQSLKDEYTSGNGSGTSSTANAKASIAASMNEETPIMRSVTIGGYPDVARSSSAAATLKSSGNLDEIKIEDYFGKKTEDDSSSTSSVERSKWRVEDGSLRPVPHFYPLEKSSRLVHGILASVVAARIADCLRIMSVAAQYDCEMATAMLKTSDYVEMYVHLFHGEGPKYADAVIVEVQRRRGDSVLFHKYCRSILDAAEGNWDGDSFETSIAPEVPLILEAEAEEKTKKHENVLLALEIAGSLIKKDRLDANRLGMESLCLLTDPKKTGLYTASVASRVVLLGSVGDDDDGDLDESHFNIREAVLSLVQKKRLNDGDFKYGDDDDDEYDLHPDEQDHMDLLHNLGLAALANALDAFANNALVGDDIDTATILLNDSKLDDGEDLVSALIEELKLAETRPHDAFLSAKCLRVLIDASSEARERAHHLDVYSVVKRATAIGHESHALLARESESVFSALNSHE